MNNRAQVRRAFLEEIKNLEGNVLELGYGDPHFFKKFSRDSFVFGLEKNDMTYQKTLDALQKGNNKKVLVSLGQIEKMPYNDNQFDYIILSFVFCCLKNMDKSLMEIARVCKTNSILYSFDHCNCQNICGYLIRGIAPIYSTINMTGCNLDFHSLRDVNHLNSSLILKFWLESEEIVLPWVFSKWEIVK